jgi:carboxylesterase
MSFVAILAALAATVLWRRRTSARLERESVTRRTLGPEGIVRGAESIELSAPGDRAVLLLHGFGDTPQSLRSLAEHLNAIGWSVRAPLLPGHGRSPRDFDRVSAAALVQAAREELRALRARHTRVAIVGQSMGGALGAILAAEGPSPPALVLIAPYLAIPTAYRHAARVHYLWGWSGPFLRSGGERSIRDAAARDASLAIGLVSGRALHALASIVARALAALPAIAAPTLVIHSREDNRIPAAAAARAFERLGTAHKRLVWTEGNGHVLTVDTGFERVHAMTAEWLEAHVAPVAHARSPER